MNTIDLFRIHENLDQLSKLHDLQRDRLDDLAITSGDRPSGMRLSIADPVRRVKAALDPFWALSLDDGVGSRGHILEDYLEVALFHDESSPLYEVRYTSQEPIQWHKHGRSAFDWVARVNATDRVISCKSSIRSDKPSSENVAQEKRMMALAGYAPGSEFDIWVINPSTFRATGPHTYTLDADDIARARLELAGVTSAYGYFSRLDDPTQDEAWNDPDQWREHWCLESNSGAFRLERLDASGAIEARNRAFLRARARLTEAKADEEAAKEAIRLHVEEQLAAAERDGKQVKSIVAYSGDEEASYSITKNGAMRVTVKQRDVVETAA